MEESTHVTGSADTGAKRPSMQQRLRDETALFEFDTLLKGVASLELPSSSSGTPASSSHASVLPSESSEGPVTPRLRSETPRQTGPQVLRPALRDSGLRLSSTAIVVCLTLAGLAVVGSLSWRGKGERAMAPNRALIEAARPVVSVGGAAPAGGPDTIATPAAATRLPDPTGRMPLRVARTLVGPFSYWFVAASQQASPPQTLPATDAQGRVVLTVPAAYNHAGAQLRVLDQKSWESCSPGSIRF